MLRFRKHDGSSDLVCGEFYAVYRRQISGCKRANLRVFAAAFGAKFTLNRLNLTAFFTVRF